MEKNFSTDKSLRNEIIVESAEALEDILAEHNVDISNWKHELSNKTIDDLWREITDNEAKITIEDGEIFRNIEVLRVNAIAFIEGSAHMLHEYQQYNGHGIRRRNIEASFSEKKTPNEPVEVPLARAFSEELGTEFLPENLRTIDETPKPSIREAKVFPNLKTKYSFYDAQIELFGDQNKPEYKEEQPEKGKTNYFFWEKIR